MLYDSKARFFKALEKAFLIATDEETREGMNKDLSFIIGV